MSDIEKTGPLIFPVDMFRSRGDALEQKLVREAHQHTKAVWLLADYELPPDVREMSKVWKMEQVLTEMWRQAFIAGWRAAHKEMKDG